MQTAPIENTVASFAAAQGSQVVKAAVCKTVYRWFDSIPWECAPMNAPGPAQFCSAE
jgi:hypothetical protein